MIYAQHALEFLLNNLVIFLITTIIGMLGYFWKKIFIPILRVVQDNQCLREDIFEIRKELQTNGGKSLKDTIVSLKNTCERIESASDISSQRSQFCFYHNCDPIFEVDADGKFLWGNKKFQEDIEKDTSKLQDFNWINIIVEEHREEFITELNSCIEMSRRLDFITETTDGSKIRLDGLPYKSLNKKKQFGFLFNISIL